MKLYSNFKVEKTPVKNPSIPDIVPPESETKVTIPKEIKFRNSLDIKLSPSRAPSSRTSRVTTPRSPSLLTSQFEQTRDMRRKISHFNTQSQIFQTESRKHQLSKILPIRMSYYPKLPVPCTEQINRQSDALKVMDSRLLQSSLKQIIRKYKCKKLFY